MMACWWLVQPGELELATRTKIGPSNQQKMHTGRDSASDSGIRPPTLRLRDLARKTTHTNAHTHASAHTNAHAHARAYVCERTYKRTCTCTRIRMHCQATHTHAHTNAHAHARSAHANACWDSTHDHTHAHTNAHAHDAAASESGIRHMIKRICSTLPFLLLSFLGRAGFAWYKSVCVCACPDTRSIGTT